MISVTSWIGREHYETHIKGQNGTEVRADEPADRGGTNMGMTPGELLAASLASCTCITLRMYADRKEWPLERADITIDIETDQQMNITNITMNILLTGTLDDTQRNRLMDIGAKCPIHKLLKNPVQIKTTSL
jgi:putative redox protein